MNANDIYLVVFHYMDGVIDPIWVGGTVDSARGFVREFGFPVKQIDEDHLAPWCEDAYEVDGTDMWFSIQKFDPTYNIQRVKAALKVTLKRRELRHDSRSL